MPDALLLLAIISTVRPNLKGFAVIKFNIQDVICSTGFAVITPKVKNDSDFIHQSLYSEATGRQLYRLLVGSNYPAINNIDVENLWLSYPSLEKERFQISEILVTWDNFIENNMRSIKSKIILKQALMQQLLTGKIGLRSLSNPIKKQKRTTVICQVIGNIQKLKKLRKKFVSVTKRIGMYLFYLVLNMMD